MLNSLRYPIMLSLLAIFMLNNIFIKNTLFDAEVSCTSWIASPSSHWSSFHWRRWRQASMLGIIELHLGLSDLESSTHHQTSSLDCGFFFLEKDRELFGTCNFRSASSRTRSSCHWIFQLWSFLHQTSRTKAPIPVIGARIFLMTMNKNRSDQKKNENADLSKYNTKSTPKIIWKIQNKKKPRSL